MKLSVLTGDYHSYLGSLGYERNGRERLYRNVLFFDVWLEHTLGYRETYTDDLTPDVVGEFMHRMNTNADYGHLFARSMGTSLREFLVYLDERGQLPYNLESFNSLTTPLN